MNGRAHGRVAVVTGAAQGIGQVLALRLAAEGAAVAVLDIGDATGTVDQITAGGGKAASFVVDISDRAQVLAVVAQITAALGTVDILVNNAGIYPRQALADITLADWRRVFSVNVESVLITTQAFSPGMAQQGWGRIVNMSSNAVGLVAPDVAHYIASKMAVIGLTRATATELGGSGVTANALSPSVVRTPGTAAIPEQAMSGLAQLQAIKRVQEAEDLAGPLAFLVSDDAAFMTGQNLYVDGGLMRPG